MVYIFFKDGKQLPTSSIWYSREPAKSILLQGKTTHFFSSIDMFTIQHYYFSMYFEINCNCRKDRQFFFSTDLSVNVVLKFALFTAQHNHKVTQVWGGSAISPEINEAAFVRERCQHGKHVRPCNNEDVNHGIYM